VLSKILGALAAVAGFVALFFRGQAHKERAERTQGELDRTKAASEVKDKATEAMVKGVIDENKKAKRGSFDAVRDRMRKR
jgi:hypothetical protein